jgi:hypothetical protein
VKDKIAKAWASISPGQGIGLAGLLIAVGYVGVHLPPEVWERIAAKDPAVLGAGVGGFLAALVAAFSSSRSAS